MSVVDVDMFEQQMRADRLQGYDFIGYHAYANNWRYYEMPAGGDLRTLQSAVRAVLISWTLPVRLVKPCAVVGSLVKD